MKTSILRYFLFGSLFFFLACDGNNYNGGNYQEQVNSHNYADGSGGDNNGSPYESRAREHWQKPRLVMGKMGDLKDKVIADIGAGPYGYFTLQIANKTEAKKIIAIDIDREAIQFIENQKIISSEAVRNRIETRLAEPDDSKLKNGEADIVLVVNTYMYFENPVAYFKNLRKGISEDGKLVIIDFKKRNTSEGPPSSFRTAIGKVEQDLMKAGYVNIISDDQSLEYQYIIIARPGLED